MKKDLHQLINAPGELIAKLQCGRKEDINRNQHMLILTFL